MIKNKILPLVLFFIMALQGFAQQSQQIVPDSFLREWDPITILFASDIGLAEGGPLDVPGEFLQISPSHPGEYRWIDSKTLQFSPAVRWQPLETYLIRSMGKSFHLSTMMNPPARMVPSSGSANLDPVSSILLSFPETIDPEALAQMISIELQPLPGIGSENITWLTASDFSIEQRERTPQSSGTDYLLTLQNPIDYGTSAAVILRLSEDERIEGSIARYTFSTKAEFRLTGMGSGSIRYPVSLDGSVYPLSQAVNCGTGNARIYLEFSENLAPLSMEQVKSLVSFDPAVSELSYQVSGKKLYLSFQTDREVPYQLKTSYQAIESTSGRVLHASLDSSFYFYYQQLAPYLQWNNGESLSERFGPQELAMQGRAADRIDLRIYKIDPLNLDFWPFPSHTLAVDENVLPPLPGEEDFALSMEQEIRLLGSPDFSRVVELPIGLQSRNTSFGLDLAPYLEETYGENQPGTYLVGYRPLGDSSTRYYLRLAVTDLCLSTIEEEHSVHFFVTSLSSGELVKDARVVVEGIDDEGEWIDVFSGTTDAYGHFAYEHKEDLDVSLRRIRVEKEGDMLVLDPSEPPPSFRDNHWYRSSNSWLSWLSSEPRSSEEASVEKAFLCSERPVYRPEEKVYLLGFIRSRQQGDILAASDDSDYSLHINGPGSRYWDVDPVLDAYDSFTYVLEEEDLPSGDYTATLFSDRNQLASVTFKLESYRVPRFEVNLTAPDKTSIDKAFEVSLTADYYAGGRVAQQPVNWTISRYPYTISLPAYPDFSFSSYENLSRGSRYNDSSTSTRNTVTDDEGSSIIEIDPTDQEYATASRYFVEATVRGADNQTVTDTALITALPPFAIGLKMDRFIREGNIIDPEIIVIDYNEEPLAGKELTVRLIQRQWHSILAETDFATGEARYITDVVDLLIKEETHLSLQDALKLEYQVEDSGVYIIEVLARDETGRLQKVSADMFLSGDSPSTWENTHSNVFETTLNQDTYIPGETAQLLLKSPYQEAHALIIVEDPVETGYYWTEIHNGQGMFSLKIAEDMVPRVPIHTLLMRGRLPGTGENLQGRVDRGKPVSMANTTYINVEPAAHQLEVTVDHKDVFLPGERMELTLNVVDFKGDPIDGQAAVWLVDRAVLSLGEEKTIDPLASFIDPVQTLINIRDSRNLVVGNLPIEELSGGGGGGWDDRMYSMNEESLLEQASIRQNFQTVPYYNARVPIVDGKAQISLNLPDNLTDFALRVIAVGDLDEFGTARSVVSIRLPVIVQSAFPRFLRPGDQFNAGGIGRIVEGESGLCQLEAELTGLNLAPYSGAALMDSVFMDKGRAYPFYFPMVVPKESDLDEAGISLAVQRVEDGAIDAFSLNVPIINGTQDRRLMSLSQPEEGETASLDSLRYPVLQGSGSQNVFISFQKALALLLEGFNYMAQPVGFSSGLKLNQVYPVLALQDLTESLGLQTGSYLSQQKIDEVLVILKASLNPSGLISYFPGGRGSVSLTSNALRFLALSEKSGYKGDLQLKNSLSQSLTEALRSDYNRFLADYSFNERVEALSALALSGRFYSDYAYDLARQASSADLYAQAQIMVLLYDEGKENFDSIEQIRQNLWDKTVFLLEDGEEVFRGLEFSRNRWGGLNLSSQTKTLAMVIRALSRSDADSPRLGLMMDTLLRQGLNGWNNPDDAAGALTALGESLRLQGSNRRSLTYQISFGREEAEIELDGEAYISSQLDSDIPGKVKLLDADRGDLPYVLIQMSYTPDILSSDLEAVNEGFIVQREQLLIENGRIAGEYESSNTEPGNFTINDLVEEHIHLTNPSSGNFVVLEIPLAAGFEILSPELAINGSDAVAFGRNTVQATYTSYNDDSVIYYFETLSSGSYDFYFRCKASFSGIFNQPPAKAYLLYDPVRTGSCDGAVIELAEE